MTFHLFFIMLIFKDESLDSLNKVSQNQSFALINNIVLFIYQKQGTSQIPLHI